MFAGRVVQIMGVDMAISVNIGGRAEVMLTQTLETGVGVGGCGC